MHETVKSNSIFRYIFPNWQEPEMQFKLVNATVSGDK